MRPTMTPRAIPGAAASITFQNESRSLRIRGSAATIAPMNPPSSEMPPFQTLKASPTEW